VFVCPAKVGHATLSLPRVTIIGELFTYELITSVILKVKIKFENDILLAL